MSPRVSRLDQPAHLAVMPEPPALKPVVKVLTHLWGDPSRRRGDFIVWLWDSGDRAHVDLKDGIITTVFDGQREVSRLASSTRMAVAA